MKACLDTCSLNTAGFTVDMLHSQADTDFHTLKAKAKNGENYQLSYAPVGNSPAEPSVIIVGKTPGLKTLEKFMSLMRSRLSMEHSAFQSVYSNMKLTLFNMLNTQTGFFDFMELVAPDYWKGKDRLSQWNAAFDKYNSSQACSIQLTQSCNCCIHTSDSNEPNKSAYKEISSKNPDCLFSSFIVTDKLKMIVFLDSPSKDSRFHPEYLFLRTDKARQLLKRNIIITSFPHPSGASPVSSLMAEPERLKKKYPYAYQAIERTKKAIEDCISAQQE